MIKHVFKNKFDNYKKYLVGWKYFASKKDEDDIKQSDFNGLALDYKVKIEASNEIKCPIAYRGKGIGAYFFMEEKDAKYSSMFEHVNVEILCMHEELLKELNHHRLEGGGFRCCGWKPPKAP
ncbi:MAG: hypothetical protein FWG10_14715 [Eubacteriaceae bacterium]|nr:hypothetical protein [Eubacteriaceae bacterium]